MSSAVICIESLFCFYYYYYIIIIVIIIQNEMIIVMLNIETLQGHFAESVSCWHIIPSIITVIACLWGAGVIFGAKELILQPKYQDAAKFSSHALILLTSDFIIYT